MTAITAPGLEPLHAPTYQGLFDVFTHLWTRCDEASARAGRNAKNCTWPAEARREFDILCTITEARSIHGRMQHLLAEAAEAFTDERNRLRVSLGQAVAENVQLRRELAECQQQLDRHRQHAGEIGAGHAGEVPA